MRGKSRSLHQSLQSQRSVQAGRRVGGGQAGMWAGGQACRQSNQTDLQVDNGAQGLGVEGSGHLLPANHLWQLVSAQPLRVSSSAALVLCSSSCTM